MDYTPNIDAQGMRRPMGPVDRFSMNGYLWRIKFVNPNDKMLMDRTGKMTLATTDTNLATIFMSRSLSGALLMKVLYP